MSPHAALAHVLVVTDTIFDPQERAREVQAMLAGMGYVLVSTRSAAEALDRARGSYLRLVVVDEARPVPPEAWSNG